MISEDQCSPLPIYTRFGCGAALRSSADTLRLCVSAVIMMAAIVASLPRAAAEERHQSFDLDPNWDGFNNRAKTPEPQVIRQDFGYSKTNHAGGERPGELGGHISPAAEPAYYAKEIKPASFNDRLTASGKLNSTNRHFHVLLGFFNADSVNEWRTPNSIVLRLYGRGDVFYAYVEYATSRWRAGGDSPGGFALVDEPGTGKKQLKGFERGKVHTWSLDYDPAANQGRGSIRVTIGDETAICHLDPGHKQDGATFNRFGLLAIPKSYDQSGEVWFDDITVNGQRENFDRDPQWDATGNRRTYTSNGVRPRFNFGFTPTHFAGGKRAGELGGTVFRGDNRYAERLAYYGDRLEPLSTDKPLKASGKITLRRGVSDSTTLIGFFHSKHSIAVSSQGSPTGFPENFLGVAIEGPSREGFLFYPVYRFPAGHHYAQDDNLPHILPDGTTHDWSLEYDPTADGAGRITVTFDAQHVELPLVREHRKALATFDRFGIVTTWIDGNAQEIYFDDLTYTARQE